MIAIRVNKAGNGDCISIQVKDHFILIDGGTADSFDDWKTQVIGVIKKIDTLIITHIDNDHVNGIIKLLQHPQCPEIGEIYFNGVEQLLESNICVDSEDKLDRRLEALKAELSTINQNIQIGYSEGTSLSYLIKSKNINCNPIVAGEAIFREKVAEFYSKDIKFNLIGPTSEDLNELRKKWKDKLRQKNIKARIISKKYAKAFETYLSSLEQGNHLNKQISSTTFNTIDALASSQFVTDPSLPNKSSLSFLIEYDEKKILCLGDCHVETVESWLDSIGVDVINVDLVKISHHGSKNNTSLSLLNRINCQNYYISTNGNIHNHPDLETLAKITKVNKSKETFIYLNYEIKNIPAWFLEEINNSYSNIKIMMGVEEIDL
ncbi:MBL fold metallo-hydrolase [Acinetobacter sp. ANC 5378]|uniref:ComEC/Rec2 family competence protein n=1 Tax=Acinetobacter sp. ANC 5378 TaxID=2731249 RepID=UPI00148FFD61|nr:MBL fold metallo-hydrolase [Acinetobacter sp. ANC 5378]NNG81330.1 MBL fold metallo-hydrolase [Acinetobacter sp. ANC 5378]